MTLVLEIVIAAIIVVGATVVGLAAIGVLRFPDPFMRMHAATKAAVVGTGLLLLGSSLSIGSSGAILTALLCVWFLFATAPIASHALGRASYVSGAPLAPLTVRDALNGVLERQTTDAGFTEAVPRDHTEMEERDMTVKGYRAAVAPVPESEQALPRRVILWLLGGESQEAAATIAIDLARSTGARLTALTAVDTRTAESQGPRPIGGTYWAQWSAAKRLATLRTIAAESLARFEAVAEARDVMAGTRHEEGDFRSLLAAVGTCDLLIVPAGVDRYGIATCGPSELAYVLAADHPRPPVLRVQRAPARIERACLLVAGGGSPDGLGQAFLQLGLWPDAHVVVAGTEEKAAIHLAARGQYALLRSRGRSAELVEAGALGFDRETAAKFLEGFDLAILAIPRGLSRWLPPRRPDLTALALDRTPIALLP